MSRLSFLLLFFVLLKNSEQRSTPEDDSYVAAVVEYQVSSDMDHNLQSYLQYIEQAAEQSADIVVFPEMTLTRGTRSILVPIHSLLIEHPIPALEPERFDEILVAISAAARQHEVYVVINIQEELDCTNASGEYCPEAQTYLFNTNVVFGRDGAVIDRYRKINLFGEFTRTPALQPDLGIFSTDFGVTFGHFICFDLMFQVPAIQVVQKHNLTDVVFTTMWFSEMPYLSATQIQEAYAYSMDINFLASGANNVGVGSAGSGIYSGKAGALISIMPGVPTTRLLVARVPKIPGQVSGTYTGAIYDKDHDGLVLISDPSLPSHVSRLLVPGYQEFTLVDKDVACTFRVRLNYRDGETIPRYRAFVKDGSNTYSRREIGVVTCAVVACRDSDAKTCPFKFSEKEVGVEIKELEIEMTTYRSQYNDTLHCANVVYYPESFTIHKFPLDPRNITFNELKYEPLGNEIEENQRKHLVYSIVEPQKELISFGIWGRLYTRDVNHYKGISEKDKELYKKFEANIFGISYP